MSKFIYFTPEEKARAQNTDLVSMLRAQGERPVRSGREFRTPNDPSITARGNKGSAYFSLELFIKNTVYNYYSDSFKIFRWRIKR